MTYPDTFFRRVLLLSLLCCGLPVLKSNAQTVIYTEDFSLNDGGYTENVIIPVSADIVRPWEYSAGGWSTNGGRTGAHPSRNPIEMWLTSPDITVTGTGDVTLEFDHSFNFEYEASGDLYWDAGMIMVSVNGGAYTKLEGAAFSQNGYNGVLQNDFDWGYAGDFNSEEIFGSNSGGYISSIASLGSFTTGDTVSIRFRGGWDWFSIASGANWAIDSVALTLAPVPEPSTMALGAGMAALLFVFYRKRTRSGKQSK